MKAFAVLVTTLFIASSLAAETDLSSNANLSAGWSYDTETDSHRLETSMLPGLQIDHAITNGTELKGEYQFLGRLTADWVDGGFRSEISTESYRYWLGLGTAQADLKLGLQRMNFGTAQILRPLQWFDRIDPLDESKETVGVQALLIRYYWLNNSNLWLWGVSGDDLKGNELVPSEEGSLEFGGRMQFLSALGETGLSAHRRIVEHPQGGGGLPELRFGLDHRMDGMIGAWVEAAMNVMEEVGPLPLNQEPGLPKELDPYASNRLSATLGADYTFGIGNGIHCLLENNLTAQGTDLGKLGESNIHSALLASYPLGLLDGISLFGLFYHTGSIGSISFLWQRNYDYLSWELALDKGFGSKEQLRRKPGLRFTIKYDI